MSLVPSPFSRLASATVSGLVSTVSQVISGAKTFTSALIASAGVQVASLWNTNGTGASDVALTVGTSAADGGVNTSATLLKVATGIGGTELSYFQVRKGFTILSVSDRHVSFSGSTTVGAAGTTRYSVGNGWEFYGDGVYAQGKINLAGVATTQSTGRFDQSGTDSSASPGAATINKPTGVSAIASGASSVVITNSICAAASRVMVTWHGDHGAARWWVTRAAGSFTVTLSAAAGANTSFSWEVSAIL